MNAFVTSKNAKTHNPNSTFSPSRNIFRLVQFPLILPLQVLWCSRSSSGDLQAHSPAQERSQFTMFVLQGRRDPKKSDFSPVVQTSHRLGPGPTHNSRESASFDLGSMRESKDNKLSNHRLSHVPAVFPYEGRAALFAELQQYSDQV